MSLIYELNQRPPDKLQRRDFSYVQVSESWLPPNPAMANVRHACHLWHAYLLSVARHMYVKNCKKNTHIFVSVFSMLLCLIDMYSCPKKCLSRPGAALS